MNYTTTLLHQKEVGIMKLGKKIGAKKAKKKIGVTDGKIKNYAF